MFRDRAVEDGLIEICMNMMQTRLQSNINSYAKWLDFSKPGQTILGVAVIEALISLMSPITTSRTHSNMEKERQTYQTKTTTGLSYVAAY